MTSFRCSQDTPTAEPHHARSSSTSTRLTCADMHRFALSPLRRWVLGPDLGQLVVEAIELEAILAGGPGAVRERCRKTNRRSSGGRVERRSTATETARSSGGGNYAAAQRGRASYGNICACQRSREGGILAGRKRASDVLAQLFYRVIDGCRRIRIERTPLATTAVGMTT